MVQILPGVPKVLSNSAAEFIEKKLGEEVSGALAGEKKFDQILDQFVDPKSEE
jgi:hypothetical protein